MVTEDQHQPLALENLSPAQAEFLRGCAKVYIWWQSPEESLKRPARILLQVMDKGLIEDMLGLPEIFGQEVLWTVLKSADNGSMHPRAWSYWHYRLGWPFDREPPPLPGPRRAA